MTKTIKDTKETDVIANTTHSEEKSLAEKIQSPGAELVDVTERTLGGKEEPAFMIGSHLSSAGGFMAMAEAMESIGANTFQYFSRNPRGSKRKTVDPADIEAFLQMKKEKGLGPILAHAPYTLNPAGKEERIRDFADLVLAEDLALLEQMPGNLYNFHPGSHVGQGVEEGINWIVASLDRVTDKPLSTKILLETMAGKGTEIGRSFEELAEIISRVKNNEDLGVCLDTCHIHDAGYDIVNDLDGVLEEFDRVIGLDRLHAIHINDTKNPLGSRKDRHERIGEGEIGREAFSRIINHPVLKDKPFFLETPNELPGYAEEIALLTSLRKE